MFFQFASCRLERCHASREAGCSSMPMLIVWLMEEFTGALPSPPLRAGSQLSSIFHSPSSRNVAHMFLSACQGECHPGMLSPDYNVFYFGMFCHW